MQNHVRRRALLAGLIVSAATPAAAQQPLLDSLTQSDASAGIRGALSLAATNATYRLGQPDGFWADGRVRIPLPGPLGQAQSTLGRFGMAGMLDTLHERINRAAEGTMPEAGAAFVDAVRRITIADAIDIVRGPDDAATRYLRENTETRLTNLLRRPMRDALTESGAFTVMRAALREFRLTSMSNDLRDEVVAFSTEKALDGCFFWIAREELAIRRDPLRRTTDILRRVFG